MNSSNPFKNFKADFPASIVVFFVALPLCLGIALASGAPLFSGLIAGIVGGIVVGSISGSHVGVSGTAAGLATIVSAAIVSLGSFENFLLAVVIGGIIQIVFGILKFGIIGYYFPSSVIKGMLTGIGIIIILKQIPYFFGYVAPKGEDTYMQIYNAVRDMNLGSTLVAVVGLGILILWEKVLSKKGKIFKLVQGPLVAVVFGIAFFMILGNTGSMEIAEKSLVAIPTTDFLSEFRFPNWSAINDENVWITAIAIALVASLETLLCVEATDKIDPRKRVTPTNRELFAQGTGNIVSGLIGGIPITQVIVRSSANIQSGGKTKASAVIHGLFLLISVISIPMLLNKIPLSVLASVLLVVGYKLAKPSTFKAMFAAGWKQWVPFMVTILVMIFKDLLWGIGLGLAVGIVVILIKSFQNSHFLHIEDKSNGKHKIKMTLAEEVTFFNKGAILKELDNLPRDTYLELDVRKTRYLDNDIIEILEDFSLKARNRNIDIQLISERGVIENPESFIEFFKLRPKSA